MAEIIHDRPHFFAKIKSPNIYFSCLPTLFLIFLFQHFLTVPQLSYNTSHIAGEPLNKLGYPLLSNKTKKTSPAKISLLISSSD